MVKMKMKKPHVLRRFLAGICDFFVAFLLFLTLFIFVVQPLYNKYTNIEQISDSYYLALSDTNLYTYNSDTKLCYIKTPESNQNTSLTTENYVDFYEFRLYAYFNTNGQLSRYEELKEASSLYIKEGESYTLKQGVNPQVIKNFYLSCINTAIDEIFLKNEQNLTYKKTLDRSYVKMLILSSIPALAILYIAIPLCFHGGQTLGKKVFNLKIASLETGFEVKKSKIILRQISIIIIGYIMGVFTGFVSSLVFIVMPFIHKKGFSLDDFLCSTIVYENVDVVDNNPNIITVALKERKIDKKEK